MKIISLDTETTGLKPSEGHRIIEIGCVEIQGRELGETYNCLINPEREMDRGAVAQHGITSEALKDKPVFAEVYEAFMNFVRGAKVLIHNAEFDVGFLDAELEKMGRESFVSESQCEVVDTLLMARKRHSGMRNRLDDLCDRYHIDRSARDKHGALLDATLLAQVYLAMTGGQIGMELAEKAVSGAGLEQVLPAADNTILDNKDFIVIPATEKELEAHRQFMNEIRPDKV